jgi:hypothetical protein
METVWVRPRHRGYITFQNEAGRVVAQGLRDHAAATDIVDAVLKHAERVPTEEGRT